MPGKRDLSGLRFGRLTVLYRAPAHMAYKSPGGTTIARWVCRCDCGKETLVMGGNLTSGRTISCGCAVRDHLENYHKKVALAKSKCPEVFQ